MKLKFYCFLFACLFIANSFPQIKIKAVGDVMPGSLTPIKVVPPDSGKIFVKSIKSYLSGADLLFGNFEGTLISGWEKPCKCKKFEPTVKCFEFGVPLYLLPTIKNLGFNVMSLNNNHSGDYGQEVYRLTNKYLNDNGIKTAPKNGYAALVVNKKNIAIIAFSRSIGENNILNIKSAISKISDLKKKFDYVFVSFHAGKEGVSAVDMKDEISALKNSNAFSVIKFAHAVIDAGADLVIGHGPHVLRPMELYKGKLIAYSLGNFLTYGNFSLKSYCGIAGILEAELDGKGNFIKGKFVPTIQKGRGVPNYDNSKSSTKLLKTLMKNYKSDQHLLLDDDGILTIKK